jgi:hypothetical protein
MDTYIYGYLSQMLHGAGIFIYMIGGFWGQMLVNIPWSIWDMIYYLASLRSKKNRSRSEMSDFFIFHSGKKNSVSQVT